MEQTEFEYGRIHGPEDWLLYGAILVGLLVLVSFIYRRDTARHPRLVRYLLTGLRWSVYGILFWVFLDPRWRTDTTEVLPSRVLVVADASRSMSIRDEMRPGSTEKTTRQQRVSDALANSDFLANLRTNQEVTVYRFGHELTEAALFHSERSAATRDPSENADGDAAATDWNRVLEANEDQTRLGDAIAELLRRNARGDFGGPVAGIVVLSDGRTNAGASVDPAVKLAQAANIPIHTVGLGSEELPVNLRIADLQAPSRVFRGDEFKVTALVQGAGMADRRVSIDFVLRSEDAEGVEEVIESKSIPLPPESAPVSIEFSHAPEVSGHWQAIIRSPAEPGELRSDDNTATARFEVVERKTKALVVASGPTREYRFLRNLLYRDPSVELTVLLQTARDRISQEADQLLRVFPETRDELFVYDVLIGIDPDWAAIGEPGRELLVEWVAEQAGGMITIANPIHTPRLARDESLQRIRDLYPVVLKEIFTSGLDGRDAGVAWTIEFTGEGRASDFLRLDDDATLSNQRWKDFPGFYSAYPVMSIKPGASVLATFSDPRARTGGVAPPIFATQFYGSGQIFYIGSGEIWRLRSMGANFYDKFWIQAVRQFSQARLLRGTSRGALLMEAETYPLGATIPLRARLLDEQYQPYLAEAISISVVDPSNGGSEIVLAPEIGRPGRFVGELLARIPGEYRLQMLVPESSDVVEQRIAVVIPDLEFDSPRPDRRLLARLADETGGRCVPIDRLHEIPAFIEDRTETHRSSQTPVPLWDKSWVMIAVASLLSLEWLIRKLLMLG